VAIYVLEFLLGNGVVAPFQSLPKPSSLSSSYLWLLLSVLDGHRTLLAHSCFCLVTAWSFIRYAAAKFLCVSHVSVMTRRCFKYQRWWSSMVDGVVPHGE